MTLETPDNTDSPKHIVFKKNEDGLRVIDQMPAPDLSSLVKDQGNNKEKGVILVGIVGHIGHTSSKILETLNAHHVQGNMVIVSQEDEVPIKVDLPLMGFTQQLSQALEFKITKFRDEIQEIILEEREQSYKDKYTQNFHKHNKPQVQNKNFKPPIRKTQRNK